MQATITDIDPFDLPEWLGTGDVVWRADEGLQTGHLVRGRLSAEPSDDSQEIVCDLLAVDEAYPAPVVDDATRLRVHQAWRHGQVVIGEHGSRMVLAVPQANALRRCCRLGSCDRRSVRFGKILPRESARRRLDSRSRKGEA